MPSLLSEINKVVFVFEAMFIMYNSSVMFVAVDW